MGVGAADQVTFAAPDTVAVAEPASASTAILPAAPLVPPARTGRPALRRLIRVPVPTPTLPAAPTEIAQRATQVRGYSAMAARALASAPTAQCRPAAPASAGTSTTDLLGRGLVAT